jgi:hypothetical protein
LTPPHSQCCTEENFRQDNTFFFNDTATTEIYTNLTDATRFGHYRDIGGFLSLPMAIWPGNVAPLASPSGATLLIRSDPSKRQRESAPRETATLH